MRDGLADNPQQEDIKPSEDSTVPAGRGVLDNTPSRGRRGGVTAWPRRPRALVVLVPTPLPCCRVWSVLDLVREEQVVLGAAPP